MGNDGAVDRYLCLAVDVQGYGSHEDVAQGEIQQSLVQMLDAAGARADVDRTQWRREGRGDEELALIPVNAATQRVVGEFCLELAAVLHRQQLQPGRIGRLRLRMGIYEGPVWEAANGLAGRALVGVNRLMNSVPARQALAHEPDANLVLVVSQGVYHDWVATGRGALDHHQFRRVRVREKELDEDAWLWVANGHARPDASTSALATRRTPVRRRRVATVGSAGTAGHGRVHRAVRRLGAPSALGTSFLVGVVGTLVLRLTGTAWSGMWVAGLAAVVCYLLTIGVDAVLDRRAARGTAVR